MSRLACDDDSSTGEVEDDFADVGEVDTLVVASFISMSSVCSFCRSDAGLLEVDAAAH